MAVVRWRKATSRACASGIRLLMVLSVVGALIALAPSCSPVGSGQLPVAAAPTSVQSAVRYAVLTAKLHSSECVHVDTAVLRGLLVHVAFDSCLGFPGEGPPKRFVRLRFVHCS